jgi:hypothetical protein
MVEDAMSLQYALFQVMRLLTDKAVDTKRAALMLYALQIAASNLKRLHEETQEIANFGDMANEKSLMKELLEVLQIRKRKPSAWRKRWPLSASAKIRRLRLIPSRLAPTTLVNHTLILKRCHSERGRAKKPERAGVGAFGLARPSRGTCFSIARMRP